MIDERLKAESEIYDLIQLHINPLYPAEIKDELIALIMSKICALPNI